VGEEGTIRLGVANNRKGRKKRVQERPEKISKKTRRPQRKIPKPKDPQEREFSEVPLRGRGQPPKGEDPSEG